MLLKNSKDEPFFDLEAAKRNCVCFRENPELHTTIVNQLSKQHHEPKATFEFKPLPSTNGLKTQIPKSEFGKPKNKTMSDFDGTVTDPDEDESEVEESEEEPITI